MNRSSAYPIRVFDILAIVAVATAITTFAGGCSGGTDGAKTMSSTDGGPATSPTEPDKTPDAGGAATGPRAACDKYLSCLLAVTPTAYAPAVQLYGEDSACWATSAQSAGCEKSCEAAFDDIAKECTCTGTTCTSCEFPYGSYQSSGPGAGTCNLQPWDVSVTKSGGDPTLRVRFDQYDSVEVPLACGTPSTFSREIEGVCTETWEGEVSSTTSKDIVIEGTRKRTCPGDTPTTCTFRWTAKLMSP